MVLIEVAAPTQPDPPRRRSRAPVGVVGLAILVALVAAYLSDCIPGLGSGQSVGTPTSTPAPVEPSEASPAPASPPPRLGITVQGDRCRYDQGAGAAAPCSEVCAALPRTNLETVVVEVEATEGRHGSVEELRRCLVQAGFANVRVHAE